MNPTCPNCHFDDCLETDRYCIKCGHRLAHVGLNAEDCVATKRVYDSTMVHVRLGIVYLQNGKRDRAIASWHAALDLDPTNREARELLEKYGQGDGLVDDRKRGAAKAAQGYGENR
jgi:tetratricopeptide (TPR) repeat protein